MAGNNKSGRKNFAEELRIIERYSDLSEDFFGFLKKMFESKSKIDKKWASERIEKAYIRMIPQDLNLGGQNNNPVITKEVGKMSEDEIDEYLKIKMQK